MKNKLHNCVSFMRKHDIICILNVKDNLRISLWRDFASCITVSVLIETKLTIIPFGKEHIYDHDGYWRPEHECGKVSYKLLNSKQDFVAVIVNITKISVYPNTWALLTLIHLIVPKYLVSSPKWFSSISVFFPLNLHMLCMCVIPVCLSICSYEVKSRTLLVPVTRLWKTIFPQIRVRGWFQDDSSASHSLC